jgi:hypothetical protein
MAFRERSNTTEAQITMLRRHHEGECPTIHEPGIMI